MRVRERGRCVVTETFAFKATAAAIATPSSDAHSNCNGYLTHCVCVICSAIIMSRNAYARWDAHTNLWPAQLPNTNQMSNAELVPACNFDFVLAN